MAVDTSAKTTTWTYVDGEWLAGNPPLIGPVSHAAWLGSTVFDGARWFDGIAPISTCTASGSTAPPPPWA